MFCGSTLPKAAVNARWESHSRQHWSQAAKAQAARERQDVHRQDVQRQTRKPTVQEIGKDVGLTFERRAVDGEPQYNEEHLEWISSQKWKSHDAYDWRGRQVRVKI